jgi:hypothetical protein
VIPAGLGPGAIVEVVGGTRHKQRGRVVGEARSMYRGVPDWDVQMEDGMVRPLGADVLRVLAPAPSASDDDVMAPLRRTVSG